MGFHLKATQSLFPSNDWISRFVNGVLLFDFPYKTLRKHMLVADQQNIDVSCLGREAIIMRNDFDLTLKGIGLSLQEELYLFWCLVSNDFPIRIELLNQRLFQELLHLLCATVAVVVGLEGADALQSRYLGILIGRDTNLSKSIIQLFGLLRLSVTVGELVHLNG